MRVLSLFSGCGGLDLGFEAAGFKIVEAYEANASAVATYNTNLNPVCIARKLDGVFCPSVDVDLVIAGPPCQGFSTAGGYGKDDERNSLLEVACRIATGIRPKVVLIENVSGLTNAKNNGYMASAIEQLRGAGYHVEQTLVECENFGVAQRRRRIFIVARSGRRNFTIDMSSYRTPVPSVSKALAGLTPGVDGHNPKLLRAESTDLQVALRIGQGQKLCNVRTGEKAVHTWDIPAAFGATSDSERELLKAVQRLRRQARRRKFGDADPVHPTTLANEHPDAHKLIESLLAKKYLRRVEDYIDLTHTFNGKYRRLEEASVSPTVDTRFGDYRLFLHPTEQRGLTPREAARLQGFPDNFKLPASEKDSFRQVGNAVPPPVANTMAKYVAQLV